MTRQQQFTLLFTFLIGMCSGAYIYVTGFASQYTDSAVPAALESAFSLEATFYGGCERGGAVCGSYRLLDDRSYRFIPGYRPADGQPEPIEGRLASGVFNDVVETLEDIDYRALNQPSDHICDAAQDLVDVHYTITLADTVYELDTCGTKFGTSREVKVFNQIYQELQGYPVEQEATGAADMLMDRFGEG